MTGHPPAFLIRHPQGDFTARKDETVLEAGLSAGFGFAHACRNGNCYRCEGQLLTGSLYLPRNNRVIHAGEASASQVLYCLAHPLSNCEIDVSCSHSPTNLPVVETTAGIQSISPLNHDVSLVRLQLPAGKPPQWYAGQYLELRVPQGDSAFSIANAPQGGRDIELHLRHNNENQTALDILQHLQQQPTVPIRIPGGQRFIHKHNLPDSAVYFICGSTGFAPAKAMIEALLALNFEHDIHLYWGARSRKDLYLHDLAMQWKNNGDINYVPVLSEQVDQDFQQGLVHEIALADLQDNKGIFHVGGSPPMVWATYDALRAAGITHEQIHSDVFDYAPRE